LRVVVTGGAGFIGYHLTRALRQRGDDVIVYDNMSGAGTERIRSLEGVDLAEDDILNAASLQAACRGAEVIYHFAAQVSVPYSMTEPCPDADINVKGTLNVLETARLVGAKLVFASSAAVYGHPKITPIPESHPLAPISFYGLSKACAELYCEMYSNAFELPITIFRLFNVYGPHCHGVVYDLLRRLHENNSHLQVLGRPDGSKDFIYVSDAIEAITAPLEHDKERGIEVYNIGSGLSSTIDSLVLGLCRVLHVNPTILFTGSSWAGDVTKGLRADLSKVRARFGWQPNTGIMEGLERTAEWFQTTIATKLELGGA